ncbi:MAG: hypothetical protein R2878_12540 [Thermoleophilia bacterium]
MNRVRRPARRRRHRCASLGLGAAAALAFTSGASAIPTPVPPQQRVSFSGLDTNANVGGESPAIAENPRTGQHLIAWTRIGSTRTGVFVRLVGSDGVPVSPEMQLSTVDGAELPAVAYDARRNEFMVAFDGMAGPNEFEAFVHRVDATGTPIGPDIRVSSAGPDGDPAYAAGEVDIAWGSARDEYLVVWSGSDLSPQEYEISAQRITPDGTEVGPDDLRISTAGPDGDGAYAAASPAVAYNERHDEYMVAWSGDDDNAPHVAREYEIRVQRLSGDGTEIGVDDRPITDIGTPGDTSTSGRAPDIAYQPMSDRFLVAWTGSEDPPHPTASEDEISTQLVEYDGTEVGPDDQRISVTGPYVDTTQTRDPAVAADTRSGEYVVTWSGADATLPPGKTEVFGQAVSPTGTEVGDDTRITVMPAGDAQTVGRQPAIVYDSGPGRFLVAWSGNTTVAPPDRNKLEVYAVPALGGTSVGLTSTLCRDLPPAPATTPGDPSKITLTSGQLLINQRIDQAAIRRANGIQQWFDSGIEARDLCQSALGVEELPTGAVAGYTGLPTSYEAPDPRPVVVAPATAGDPSRVTLTVGQMLINQRISQAAIRRLNALKDRLDGGLTGGDIVDGAVGRAQLRAGTRLLYVPLVATPPAASRTDIAPAGTGNPSSVTLSTGQMLINQRISQAAVRRANDLIRRLNQGLGPNEIRNGALSAADLAPGVAVSTTP